MPVYNDEDLNQVCRCECCEIELSTHLGILTSNNVTIITHLCGKCLAFCEDLYENSRFILK